MGTLPMYVWAMVLVGLTGTTATICVMLFAWRPYRRLQSRQRHPGSRRIRDPLGRLGVGECVACRRRRLSVRADEARPVAPGRVDGFSRDGAAADPYPCGLAHLGPAGRAVAADVASDLSGGRRDLPGCDGVGQAAGRVRATCWAGRHGNWDRGRVRRAQPSARRGRPPRGVVSTSWASSISSSLSSLALPRRPPSFDCWSCRRLPRRSRCCRLH